MQRCKVLVKFWQKEKKCAKNELPNASQFFMPWMHWKRATHMQSWPKQAALSPLTAISFQKSQIKDGKRNKRSTYKRLSRKCANLNQVDVAVECQHETISCMDVLRQITGKQKHLQISIYTDTCVLVCVFKVNAYECVCV